jgi:5-methylcytosine-specific restriction protein A
MANKPKQVKRSWVVERKPFERDNSNADFYNSWSWRKLRKNFIQRFPLCKHCEEKDEVTVATVVDHIVPINSGGEPLKESNLQSLCESCHNKKSATEARKGGMG